MTVSPRESVTGGEVSSDGVIIVRGLVDGYPVEIGLKPRLDAGKVEWRCGVLKRIEGWFVPENGYAPKSCPPVASLSVL